METNYIIFILIFFCVGMIAGIFLMNYIYKRNYVKPSITINARAIITKSGENLIKLKGIDSVDYNIDQLKSDTEYVIKSRKEIEELTKQDIRVAEVKLYLASTVKASENSKRVTMPKSAYISILKHIYILLDGTTS